MRPALIDTEPAAARACDRCDHPTDTLHRVRFGTLRWLLCPRCWYATQRAYGLLPVPASRSKKPG